MKCKYSKPLPFHPTLTSRDVHFFVIAIVTIGFNLKHMIKEADLELSFVSRKYFLYRAILFVYYFSKCGKFSSNF